jgi:hypothetical protein
MNKTYQEWVQEIQWLRDKIILPDGKRISKESFMTNSQIDADKLNTILMSEHKGGTVTKRGNKNTHLQ